ncbi:MAG: aspartate--tRNA(Asn) ligase [Thermoplasmata archaeon]|nr:aspartate--tRNA(Asn) ligase [Candidatus Sysuiplasma acidicola]MBX8646901.1 aspartate--tRNA(Asn) ligase [Candidatus Sysuiplasma acidicola]
MSLFKVSAELGPENDGQEVVVKGWVEEIRDLGGISFYLIRDGYGSVQVTLLKKKAPAEVISALEGVSRESVVEIRGTLRKSEKSGRGFEIIPSSASVLARAMTPLPMGVVDRVSTEMETRLDNRFIDIRRADRGAIFRARSDILQLIRQKLDELKFVEVSTPKIVSEGAEGGATLFKVDYFGRKAYLAQSPQLYKQMLMASGLNRVYEIASAYRAELSDTVRHTSEFVSFDAEMAFIDTMDDVLDALQAVLMSAISRAAEKYRSTATEDAEQPILPKTPFPRLTYSECLDILGSEGKETVEGDIDTEGEKLIGRVMKERGHSMYFITKYPAAVKPFYVMEEKGTEFSYSFDLEYDGTEMASGGVREHRYDELVSRMKRKNLDPAGFEFYLKSFRYGMPPHGGWGLGVDRLVSTFLGLGNVREAILFPRDRSRLSP